MSSSPISPAFPNLQCSITPSIGSPRRSSASSGVLIVLSRYSIKKTRPMPPKRPSTSPTRILIFLLGLNGRTGVSACSTTQTLIFCDSSVTFCSFNREKSASYIARFDSTSRFKTSYWINFSFRPRASAFVFSSRLRTLSSLAWASSYSFLIELLTR